ncbi:MAG: NADPH-dependent FMN reductase [Candidatus Hydrogenedentota bacterium]
MAFVVISCSLNPQSRSRALAHLAAEQIRSQGGETVFIDLRDHALPFCDGTPDSFTSPVSELAETIANADAVLLGLPVYNYGVNAAAKNLLELTGAAWEDRIVGFLCAAGGRSSYMAPMSFANSLMLDYHCLILPRMVHAAADQLDETGRVLDPQVENRIDALVKSALRYGHATRMIQREL